MSTTCCDGVVKKEGLPSARAPGLSLNDVIKSLALNADWLRALGLPSLSSSSSSSLGGGRRGGAGV